MSRLNVARTQRVYTHEGAPAYKGNALEQLRRSVLACMLWEETFYEGGVAIADRILELAMHVAPEELAALAVEARSEHQIRHASLLLVRALLARGGGKMVGDTVAQVIQRADEPGELIAMYHATNDKKALPKQLKRGIGIALNKFDAYQLAKYDRKGDAVRLRDAMFLCHPKPRDEQRAELFKQLANGTLPIPDTWEVALSTGGNKREEFTRLLNEHRLGYMALLRNLRNMDEAGVDKNLIGEALMAGAARSRALPFRFVSAAKAAPWAAQVLSDAMLLATTSLPKLQGSTHIFIDVSGSMRATVSAKSQIARCEVACALAILAAEVSPMSRVFMFGTTCEEIPNYRGLALLGTLQNGCLQVGHGTNIGAAVRTAPNADRVIVVTDMQSHDRMSAPQKHGYILNVAPYKYGIGKQNGWTLIDGFSEQSVRYMHAIELEDE